MSTVSTGSAEVNDFYMKFIDDETNVYDQSPLGYRLMNVARGLKKAMQDQSISQELDLASSDPENIFSDYVDKVELKFNKLSGLEKRIQITLC